MKTVSKQSAMDPNGKRRLGKLRKKPMSSAAKGSGTTIEQREHP